MTSAAYPASQGFSAGVHIHRRAAHHYKLYIPPGRAVGKMPMVVMLHGCTQDPDVIARETDMNAVADQLGFIVLYPAQSFNANYSRCWNWFRAEDQQRGRGEPAMLASLTKAIIARHRVDRSRVFIAGMSAGGAMAALVAYAYPEVFAALGVHSGIAPPPHAYATVPVMPTIVFHGDSDGTVPARRSEGFTNAKRRLIAGAGHEWSRAPNASREMARFFLAAGK